jgi:hypothetical protein
MTRGQILEEGLQLCSLEVERESLDSMSEAFGSGTGGMSFFPPLAVEAIGGLHDSPMGWGSLIVPTCEEYPAAAYGTGEFFCFCLSVAWWRWLVCW